MANASLLAPARSVYYDANGNPLRGGKVHTYVPGSATPKQSWQDAAETILNANPIILDANGSCLLYGNGAYQITVMDSLGNSIPAYSGVTTTPATASPISSAMAPVVGASTLAAGIAALFLDNKALGQTEYARIFPGVISLDNVVGYTEIGPGSTLIQTAAVAGYARALVTTTGGNQNAVALFGAATAEVDGAAAWGINTLLQDSASRTPGSGAGRFLVNEFDFNVMESGTQVIGCSVGGNSLAQPSAANGFIVNTLGNAIKWGGGFVTEDGVADFALSIGASAVSGPNFASQTIGMSFFDSTGAKQIGIIELGSLPSGVQGIFNINGSIPISVSIANGGFDMVSPTARMSIGGLGVVGPRVTGWGTATGGSPIAFNGTSATLLQTSQAVAYLIASLFAHGLIGP